ncbi:MAG: integrase core domain-containing protein, partial [Candidatus Liptonbacteria bacterium]|nr:integrase core domain-containing protein [Candidatus Liptonbacteria bacterium]
MPTSHILPGAIELARIPTISKEAKKRLAWFDWYRANGENATLTCRHFGISRECFYEWKRRYDPWNLATLEEKSRAPKKTRTWEVSRIEEFRIKKLRRAHIRWGKMKLRVLYEQEYGIPVSSWKIQRVILKHRLYFHPKKTEALRKKRKANEPKRRITELAKEERAGFLVALDTIERHTAGFKRYILTGIDIHSKIAFARMYPTKHSKHAADFLRRINYLFDAKIENLQTDNGSEFAKHFREAAAELSLPHYHSRPRTPKDNPVDERFNGTIEREFLQMGNMVTDCAAFNRKITEWLIEYNFKRPHQALGYQVPVEYHYQNQKVSSMYPSST